MLLIVVLAIVVKGSRWLPTSGPAYTFEKLSTSQKESLCFLWTRSAGRTVQVPSSFIDATQERAFRRAGIDVLRESDSRQPTGGAGAKQIACKPVGWLRSHTGAILFCYELDLGEGSDETKCATVYRSRGTWDSKLLISSSTPLSLQASICNDAPKSSLIIVDNPKELRAYLGKGISFFFCPEANSGAASQNPEFVKFEFHRAFWIDKDLLILRYYQMDHPKGNDVSYESYMTDFFQLKGGRWSKVGNVFPPAGE